ncbi:hypothetical protein L208DRAFT_1413841, partial [Tricholoma matsutake]
EQHPSWENNVATGASELNKFCEKITITSKEKNRLKIPESKQDSLQIPKQTSFVPSLEPLPPISLLILPRFNYTSGMQKMSAYSSTDVFS